MKLFPHRRAMLLGLLTPVLLWCGFPGGGNAWPVLFIALVPFLVSLPSLSLKRAAQFGFVIGLLHYLLQLYWIVIVLGRYGGLPIFIAVPATLLLAAYMAAYLLVFSLVGRLCFDRLSPKLLLWVLPMLWVGIDWLRGTLFTGFPWMDIGYALASEPRLIQTADLFGHGSVSFLIVLVNTLIALLVLGGLNRSSVISLVVPACVMLGASSWYCQVRWQAMTERLQAEDAGSAMVGVVKGNIDQSMKWSPQNQQSTVATYIKLSQSLFGEQRPDLVIWPETALPLYLQTYRDAGVLYGLAAQYDTGLLTGAPWFEVVDRERRDIRYYNSAQLLLPDGSFGGSYYKSHLVPFGEYVPLKRFLPFLAPLVEAVGDFSPGSVGEPLAWRKARAGVLICFESIFPDIARKWVENGANVLVNLTNDAWYGKSSAPYHSLAMSVFRAVETRRAVVRSANTGVSGFIDPLGRVEEPSAIFTTWAKGAEVRLLNGKTTFVGWGYMFGPFCLVCGLVVAGLSRVRRLSRFD